MSIHCGTEAGAARHYRNREAPDRACLDARARACRARRRKTALAPQQYAEYLLRELIGVLAGLMAGDR